MIGAPSSVQPHRVPPWDEAPVGVQLVALLDDLVAAEELRDALPRDSRDGRLVEATILHLSACLAELLERKRPPDGLDAFLAEEVRQVSSNRGDEIPDIVRRLADWRSAARLTAEADAAAAAAQKAADAAARAAELAGRVAQAAARALESATDVSDAAAESSDVLRREAAEATAAAQEAAAAAAEARSRSTAAKAAFTAAQGKGAAERA
jgi:hypothetical protein